MMLRTAAILASSLVSLSLVSCGSGKVEEETEESAVITVKVASPEVRSVAIDSRFAATIETDTVNVVPMVAGEVTSKNFEVGDHVEEGDLLFTIDDEAAKIAVTQANAALTTAKAGYDTSLAQNIQAQAQSGVTFAGIIEGQKQMEYSLDSAKAGSIQAKYSANSAHRTLEYYEEQISNIDTDINDANDTLDKIDAAINKAKKATPPVDTTGLETQKQSIKSTIRTLENSKDQMEMYRDTGRNSAGSADSAYMNTLEAIELAELQLEDYKKYNEVAAMWGINTSLVSADAGLKSADAAVKQAQAAVENAKIALDHTTVKAPVSGTITAINVSEHNLASQGAPAYVIEDETAKKIVFYVADETVRNLAPGNTAVVSRNNEEYEAKIVEVGTTVDQNTGLYKVKAVSDADFNPGTSVTVTTASRIDNSSVTVPFNAVYYDGEQPFVYIVENGKARRRDIESGISDGDLMAVTSGLTPADTIIISWSSGLREGADVVAEGADDKSGSGSKDAFHKTASVSPAVAPQTGGTGTGSDAAPRADGGDAGQAGDGPSASDSPHINEEEPLG